MNVTLLLPGLPDDAGRLQWHPHELEHRRGWNLATYLDELGMRVSEVSHVVVHGKAIDPAEMVAIPVRESRAQRVWRKLRRRPAPTVEVSTFDVYIPARGAVIHVIPKTEGKNASLYLGIVGAVVGVAASVMTGNPYFAMQTLQWAMTGYAVGSTIGTLITPRPKSIKAGDDGPSSYAWNGTQNDDRAGVPVPVLLGERLVGGKRIGMVRRRYGVVPVRAAAGDHDDAAPFAGSELLHLLLLVAGHRCQGPVGITDPSLPAHVATNKPDVQINGSHYTNFPGVQVEWRTGEPGQSIIRGFDTVANTYDLAVDLTDIGTPYLYTTVSDECDAIEVLLSLQGLVHMTDEGGMENNTTRYRLEYRLEGSSTWHNADYDPGDGDGACRRLTANTRAGRVETRRIDKFPDGSDLTRGRYELRIQWLSAEHTDADRDAWHIYLTGVTEETDQATNYEGDSLVAVRGLATDQLSGPLPTVTSVWRGYIPQKWTADGGWEAADWGVGDVAPAGKNPFWLALALMRDANIGAGNEITEAEIDLASFAASAPEADTLETVTPADGSASYTEPRHQFSIYLDQEMDAVDAIQQILSTARGTLIFSGNKWRVAVDKPGAIAQVFGMGSILANDGESTFNLQYRSERHEVNCIEGAFDDATADWETESHAEYIDNRNLEDGGGSFVLGEDAEDQMAALALPILRRKMQFWGVDRRTQVARELRFALRQAYTLRASGEFGAASKAMLCEVYDIIGVAHDVPQWGYSGRVLAGSTASQVALDAEVELEAGTSYQIRVHFQAAGDDGKDLIEVREVADVWDSELEFHTLNVTEPFSRTPAEGDEWFFGPVDLDVKPFRIVDIDRDANDERTITIAEYNESVYDLDGPIVIPGYSLLPDMAAPPGAIPQLVATSAISVRDDGRRVTDVILQWSRPVPSRAQGPYKGARVDYSLDNEHWTSLATVDGTEYRWEDAPHGIQIWFRVVPYSISGKYNHDGAAYDDIIPEGYGAPSPIITTLDGDYHEGKFRLWWTALGPEFEYEVRQANPANWSADTTGFLWRGKATEWSDDSPDARSITYYVRARDPFGNYSLAADSFTVTDTAPPAPTIGAITRFEDGFKIRVDPPAGVTDVIAIHLHASQVSGFTPSAANRVAQPVSPKGGEFFFKTSVAGLWYLKATCQDWLSASMNDWIYSSEADDEVVVIQPVNPASVVFTPEQTAEGYQVGIDGPDYRPRPNRRAHVTWTHADSVNPANSLVGFEVVLFDNVTYTDDSPLYTSGLIPNPAATGFLFNEIHVPAGTWIAAVKAVYKGGATSDFVGSDGQVYTEEENPIIRNGDDRNVAGYAESFDSASLPTGVWISDLDPTYSIADKVLTITRSASGSASPALAWDLEQWSDVALDTRRNGATNILIRARTSVAGATVTISGEAPVTTKDLIADGEFHNYRIPGNDVPGTGTYSVYFAFGGLGVGQSVDVTCIAVLFESVDLEWDGSVDKGIRARQQFDVDPDGDGLYGIAPVRLGDANGNYVAVEENGVFFLRDEAGNLVNETAYKLGRSARFSGYTHGAQISFDDENGWGLTIKIPEPTSYNKARFIPQDVANDFMPSDVPAATTVRRWMEACNFGEIAGEPGFMLAGAFFYGGTLETYSAPGPWSSTQQSKSELLLGTDSDTTDATTDAWYYVKDDVGLPNDLTPPNIDIYFRIVVWIAVTMPTSKRSSGSYHYCDLEFTTRIDDASMDGTKMNLAVSPRTEGPFKVRLLANGQTTLVPIVIGAGSASDFGRDTQNVKVDWHGQTWETGGTGTPTCEIHKIDWSYIEQCEDYNLLTLADIGFAWLEEFGG